MLSLICRKTTSELKKCPKQEINILEGYNGKESVVHFLEPIIQNTGRLTAKTTFGIQSLDGQGII